MTFSHRSGSLKQRNKQHKGEKKRADLISKSGGIRRRGLKVQSKRERRAALKQKRINKVAALKKVRTLRGSKENPLWCVILPLTSTIPSHLASLLLRKCDPNAVITASSLDDSLQSVVRLYSPILDKHFRIASATAAAAATYDLFSSIDWIHLADWVVLLVPSNFSGLDEHMEHILTTLYAQGLGDVSYAVMSSGADMKEIRHCLSSRFPIPEDTIYPLNTSAHALNLLRHICNPTKSAAVGKKQKSEFTVNSFHSSTTFRARMLADSISISEVRDPDQLAGNAETNSTYLCIKSEVRGAPIFLNEPLDRTSSGPYIHLTGWGDFPLVKADWLLGTNEPNQWDASSELHRNDGDDDVPPSSSNILEGMDGSEDDDDDDDDEAESEDEEQSGDENEPMEIEQQSDIDDQEDITDTVSLSSYAARTMAYSTTSAFSAAQLSKFRVARTEEMFPDEVETPVGIPARERFAKYRCLPKFYGTDWPTDKDILPTEYDQIACFRNYHRNRRSMVRYLTERQNKVDQGKLLKRDYIPTAAQVCLTLGPLDTTLAKLIANHHTASSTTSPPSPLLLCSLLPHENRLSVCHFNMKRLASALRATSDMLVVATAANKAAEHALHSTMDATLGFGEEAVTQVELADESIRQALTDHRKQTANVRRKITNPRDPSAPLLPPEAEPIKSKELMLFQVGIRRFISSPVYSNPTNNAYEKSKYEPFFSALQSSVVGSVYAPVMYAPANVLQFRIRVDENEDGEISTPYVGELVATGTLQSVDPGRLIIKRILLSGHPYKIHRRHAVVRFMFFNPQDINYFKSVPLHTKCGAMGHIKEAVGTHGHFKCVFDRQLQASDVVLMPLYKRVFPKWVYRSSVANTFRQAKALPAPSYDCYTAPVTLQLSRKQEKHQDSCLNEAELSLFA